MSRGVRQRVRARQQAIAAANRPDLSKHLHSTSDDVPVRTTVEPKVDWPRIESQHPGWWQVHRVEVDGAGLRSFVLIAECRTEREAFAVMARQRSQVRITRWGSRARPYFSLANPGGAV